MSAPVIFLSHTSRLARLPAGRSYVRAAIDGALRAGFASSDMCFFPADDRPAAEVCVRRVRECSVYVGLLGLDYGSPVPERPEVSYTELEFLTALEERDKRGMRVLVFLLDHATPLPELRPFNRAQKAFRERVLKDHGLKVTFFSDPAGLELEVFHALIALGPAPADRRAQHLPYLAPNFTGRDEYLASAERHIRESVAAGGAFCCVGFRGMGGVGKTSLVAALADRLAGDGRLFPGGVLWASLIDRSASEVARDFVHDLGGDAAGLTPEQCLTRFQELAAARRPLVVLDNLPRCPSDEGPAALLLVRARGAATLLTTRFRDAMPPGVWVRDVEAMPASEALALLRAHVGAAAEVAAADEVLQACGGLPLFVNAAGRAIANGYYTLPEYAAELRRRGLSALADEDERSAAVFDLSWRFVSEPARAVFAALALAPGDDIGPNLVEAWRRQGGERDTTQPPARLLAELANATLLLPADQRSRRFRYHDRGRDFALAQLTLPHDEVRRRLRECYTDWNMVRTEFNARGPFALAAQYHAMTGWSGAEAMGFPAWCHFARSQASILANHPELFFQQALNEAMDSPVSKEAQQRVGTAEAPEFWLEWLNRPRAFAPSAFILVLTGHSAEVTSVALSGDGRSAVSGSFDNTVRVWDLTTGHCRAVLVGHTDPITSVALSVNGIIAVSTAEDDTLRVWDLAGGTCRAPLSEHADRLNCLAVSADGKTGASGAADGTVRLWDLNTRKCTATLPGHTGMVNAVALTASGRTAVSGGEDRTLRVWDVAPGQCRAVLDGHASSVGGVAVSADGRTAVSGADDGSVRVWDLAAGLCRATLAGHTNAVLSVAVSADGRTALSGGRDGTVRIWDTTAGQCWASLEGHAGPVNSVAISADGRIAVTGSDDDTMRVWDLSAAKAQPVPDRQAIPVFVCAEQPLGMAVSTDGSIAITGARDETVRVWDLATGQCRATLKGHSGWVRAVAFSSTGRHAVSGSDDRTVRVWDLATGECQAVLEGHGYGVTRVALSPSGDRAVSGSHDQTVRVWDIAASHSLAEHPRNCDEAQRAWERIHARFTHTVRCADLFLELRAAGGDAVIARFPGRFAIAACSPDGTHVLAVDPRGTMFVLRLQSSAR